jgi:hypothetical protein
MRSDRELDEMIDTAIPGYSRIEPPIGLEQRILSRSLATPDKKERGRFAWQWSIAIPVTACLFILLFLATPRRLPKRSESAAVNNTIGGIPTHAIPSVSIVSSAPSQTKRSTSKLKWRTGQSHLPYPKQDVFPSPAPPTAEEQSLMTFSRAEFQLPRASAANIEIPPLRIAELQIKPLSSVGNSPNPATNPQITPALQQP